MHRIQRIFPDTVLHYNDWDIPSKVSPWSSILPAFDMSLNTIPDASEHVRKNNARQRDNIPQSKNFLARTMAPALSSSHGEVPGTFWQGLTFMSGPQVCPPAFRALQTY